MSKVQRGTHRKSPDSIVGFGSPPQNKTIDPILVLEGEVILPQTGVIEPSRLKITHPRQLIRQFDSRERRHFSTNQKVF